MTYVFNRWWVVGGETSIGPYFSRFEAMFVLAEENTKQEEIDMHLGGNDGMYTGVGKMWEMAKRYNDKSKALNGHCTVVRRKKVKSVKRIGIL